MSQVSRALFILALVGGSTASLADDRREARRHFDQGNAFYDKKDYRGALREFERAQRLLPSPEIVLNVGLTREKLGDRAGAASDLDRFLGLVDSGAFPDKVKAVRARLHRVSAGLGRLTVTCNVEGATVRLDGKLVGTTPLGHRIYAEPGRVTLQVDLPGHRSVTRKMELGGDVEEAVEVKLVRLQPRGQPRTDLGQPLQVQRELQAGPAPFYKRWWFWTVVGVAVVGATTGVVVATQVGGSDRVPAGELGSIP